MADQISLKQALELVTFEQDLDGNWRVHTVHDCVFNNVMGQIVGNVGGSVSGTIYGNVDGDIVGDVNGDISGYVDGDIGEYVSGDVGGNIHGNVKGNVHGYVKGTISMRKYKLIETPKEKLTRVVEDISDPELTKAFYDYIGE